MLPIHRKLSASLLPVVLVNLLAATSVAEDPNVIISSFAADLPYDQENRLTPHVLVYEESPACTLLDLPNLKFENGFIVASVEGAAKDRVFPKSPNDSYGCRAACLDRGVERSLVGHVMPHMYYDAAAGIPFSTWFRETCTQVEVCFLNYHSKEHPLELYWLQEGRNKHLQAKLKWGERNTHCFNSFIGHTFELVDGESGELLEKITIEFTTVKAFGTSPPSDTRVPNHNYDKEIERTLNNEWKRHTAVSRTFSPLGFKKGKLPPDFFASIGSFYYNNRGNIAREEWTNKGVFVNWWETDVYFIQIPWDLKRIYQQRLKDLVEEWAGVPVEQTVMYGLRQYTTGARLLTHVDRRPTHAVSLIVNVAQGNLTEPWPVEVQDHMDRLHEVTMEAGDIVYYESAKCLHARNRPMMGKDAYYVNLFTHYRPVDDDRWYAKENPPGTPEPVLEAQGSCRLEKMGTTLAGPQGQLGIVEGVQCDDPRLGPFVSPTLFQAKSASDLIEWWRMTSPSNEIHSETTSSGTNQSAGAREEL